MATDVQVPTLGESITEGTLAQWLKKPGEAVAEDEPIASLETDKVSVEVPSPVAGVMAEQVVKEGDTVAVGAVIARIDEGATAAASAPAQAAADATTNPAGPSETPALRGDDHAPESRTPTGRRQDRRDHLVARGAPRGPRTSCRPDQHQGHRQGRPPDQGRRDRGGRGAEEFPGAGRGPGAAGESASARSKGSASWAPAFAGERAKGRARQDVAPSPDDRQAPQGSAEHRGDADDVQRRRHVGRDRRPLAATRICSRRSTASASASWASS